MKSRHVYAIINTRTGDAYVGCAIKSPRERFREHLRRLNDGTHHSPKLQAAWDRWGASAFQLATLLNLGPIDRKAAEATEAVWIGKLGTYNERNGRSWSSGMRRVHAQKVKAVWDDPKRRENYANRRTRWDDPEEAAKHSEHMKALWTDPERRQKLEARRAARWADPEAKARQSEKMRAYHAARRSGLSGV